MKVNMQIYSPFDGKVCIYSRYKLMIKALVKGYAIWDSFMIENM